MAGQTPCNTGDNDRRPKSSVFLPERTIITRRKLCTVAQHGHLEKESKEMLRNYRKIILFHSTNPEKTNQ